LGGFLFSGDTIEKKVKVLSGGEKSRLSLAKLLLIPSNLLVLDEPTNHLDMHSKDILKNALLQYNGTLIVVSHDRDFLQGLTNKVFEFKNGSIREYPGDIYDFLENRRLNALSQLELNRVQNIKTDKDNQGSENKRHWEKRKTEEKELRKLKNQINKYESEITHLESEIKIKEAVLGDPATYQNFSGYNIIFEEYNRLKKQLESEVSKWENAHLLLDNMEKQSV
jgi:ATP-binding cassette subfamily F protein 3